MFPLHKSFLWEFDCHFICSQETCPYYISFYKRYTTLHTVAIMLKSKRKGNKPFIALFLLWIGNAEIAPVSLSQWSMLFLNVLTQKHRINIIILPTDQPKIILLTVQTTTKISCFSLTAVWLPTANFGLFSIGKASLTQS